VHEHEGCQHDTFLEPLMRAKQREGRRDLAARENGGRGRFRHVHDYPLSLFWARRYYPKVGEGRSRAGPTPRGIDRECARHVLEHPPQLETRSGSLT